MKKILFPVLVLSIFGCSSSKTIDVPVPNPDQDVVNEVIGVDDSDSDNNDILPLESFGSIELPATMNLGDPRVTVRLRNQGSSAIEFANCRVEALQNDVSVSDGLLSFAGLGFIDPGRSGMGIISFFETFEDGFNSFNELRFDCKWNADEGTRIDLQNSTEQIEFLGYSVSDRGFTNVNLRRTNNSNNSAPLLRCYVEALYGDVILDVASVGFPPIDAGEAFENTGLFLSFTSLQGFNDDSFDFSLLYCEY